MPEILKVLHLSDQHRVTQMDVGRGRIETDIAGAYDHASEVMTRNMLSDDAEEGIVAFLEKRRPRWQDR